MNENISNTHKNIDRLESRGLKKYFLDLYKKGRNRDFFVCSPKSMKEKMEMDYLAECGLIEIDDGEFRINHKGETKVSEFVCRITDIGNQTARRLSR